LGTDKSPVILVDQYSGFDGKADLYDMVHPNASGEEKMAAKWFDAMQNVLKK
jgi:lysophospholipase L1-like esterase